jgi:hypothetical protein
VLGKIATNLPHKARDRLVFKASNAALEGRFFEASIFITPALNEVMKHGYWALNGQDCAAADPEYSSSGFCMLNASSEYTGALRV